MELSEVEGKIEEIRFEGNRCSALTALAAARGMKALLIVFRRDWNKTAKGWIGWRRERKLVIRKGEEDGKDL